MFLGLIYKDTDILDHFRQAIMTSSRKLTATIIEFFNSVNPTLLLICEIKILEAKLAFAVNDLIIAMENFLIVHELV